MLHACNIREYSSTINEVLHGILIEVKYIMAESEAETREEFWLYHDLEKEEIVEHRKFMDLELYLSSLENIDKQIDRKCHLSK
jgi:hypothetical protein